MRFVVIIVLFFIAGCKSDNSKEPETILYEVGDTVLAWQTDADSMIMKRDIAIPDSSITIPRIINGLNDKYPHVHLVFLKQSGDTAYTEIPDAEYLGEQMGDAGASAWFDDAVINLTSVPGINYVSFTMDLHSHAASDVIGKDRYSNWKRK